MKRWLIITVVLAAGLTVWLWLSAPPRQSVVLPDGSVLTLREVSYGKQHRHAFGPLWQRLYALVPKKIRGSRFYNVGVFTNSEPFVAFWFTRGNTPSVPPAVSFRYYLEDAQGYAVESKMHTWVTTVRWPITAMGKGFSIWPRRDRELRLGVYGMTNGILERIAGFTVRNPAPRTYPTWNAPVPPVSNSVAGYEFTLTRLLVGATASGPQDDPKPSANPYESRILASFRASRNFRESRSWAPGGMTLSDATGNRAEVGGWGLWSREGEYQMKFRSSLWPGEPWKLRVQFSRVANFSSNELVRFPPIAVPVELLNGKTTNTFAVNVSTNWQAVPLTIAAFQGSSRNFSGHALRVRCGTLPADHRVTLVKMEDDRKRNVSGGGSTSDNGEYNYALKLASNSTTVQLTFAIHKSLFAEFVAQPTLVTSTTTNAANR